MFSFYVVLCSNACMSLSVPNRMNANHVFVAFRLQGTCIGIKRNCFVNGKIIIALGKDCYIFTFAVVTFCKGLFTIQNNGIIIHFQILTLKSFHAPRFFKCFP